MERASSISIILLVVTAAVALGGQVPPLRAFPERNNVAAVPPEVLIVAGDIPPHRREAMLASAARFYRFWNTGDEMLLRQAISETFVDHTLPPGRPRDPPPPRKRFSRPSRTCRSSCPSRLWQAIGSSPICASQVISPGSSEHTRHRSADRFHRDGHRGGPWRSLYRHWHLEDNLTFLQQIGLIPH